MRTDRAFSLMAPFQISDHQAGALGAKSSAGTPHFPFLDVLRGLAILLVFLHHSLGAAYGYYWQPWKGLFPDFQSADAHWLLFPLTMGNCGVAIFFVVSGFCIHLSHIRRSSGSSETWKAFAIKRFFRIYPPYILALLVFYLSWPWRTYSLASPGWQHQFWSHALMLHNLEESTAFGINGSFWSIAVEFQLYLIYPILILLISRFGWRWTLFFLFTLEALIRLSVFPVASPFCGMHQSPLAYWFSWALGAYTADCYLRHKIRQFKPFVLVAAFGLALLSYTFSPLVDFQFMAVAILTMLLIWQAIAKSDSGEKNKRIQPRFLNWFNSNLIKLGIVSYSFYLIHQPILLIVQRLKQRFDVLADFPILSLGLCLLLYVPIFALSHFLFRYIEKPSARLGRLLSSNPRLPVASGS